MSTLSTVASFVNRFDGSRYIALVIVSDEFDRQTFAVFRHIYPPFFFTSSSQSLMRGTSWEAAEEQSACKGD